MSPKVTVSGHTQWRQSHTSALPDGTLGFPARYKNRAENDGRLDLVTFGKGFLKCKKHTHLQAS